MRDLIRIREISGAEILDSISCAYIAERFFHRSRAWMTQRLNNSLVNGKPASFTPSELLLLRSALKTVASELTRFTSNIPNLPTDMSVKVYVVEDPSLIEYLIDSDLKGFQAYLDETKENEDFLLLPEPEHFDSEAEALAFCSGIGYGTDDSALPDRYPLRTTEETDLPFITALENY